MCAVPTSPFVPKLIGQFLLVGGFSIRRQRNARRVAHTSVPILVVEVDVWDLPILFPQSPDHHLLLGEPEPVRGSGTTAMLGAKCAIFDATGVFVRGCSPFFHQLGFDFPEPP